MRPKILIALLCLSPVTALADLAEMHALAKLTLTQLQEQSFKQRREFCGFFGLTTSAELVATKAFAGTSTSCNAPFPDNIAVVASYHTHGAFDDGYFNELPSGLDVDGDAAFYMHGYVATPGGRLWFVDGRRRTVRQLCTPGCLPIAADFRKSSSGSIALEYTFEGLKSYLAK